jgi:TPR repeat protein
MLERQRGHNSQSDATVRQICSHVLVCLFCGVPISLSSIELYQQAANGGHLDAQTNLGYIYEHGSEDETVWTQLH